MKNVTKVVVTAFLAGKSKSIGTTATNGTILTLHGNVIARKLPDGTIEATLAGWPTVTTRERLNGLCQLSGRGLGFSQRKFVPFYGDAPVDPNAWVVLKTPEQYVRDHTAAYEAAEFNRGKADYESGRPYAGDPDAIDGYSRGYNAAEALATA